MLHKWIFEFLQKNIETSIKNSESSQKSNMVVCKKVSNITGE